MSSDAPRKFMRSSFVPLPLVVLGMEASASDFTGASLVGDGVAGAAPAAGACTTAATFVSPWALGFKARLATDSAAPTELPVITITARIKKPDLSCSSGKIILVRPSPSPLPSPSGRGRFALQFLPPTCACSWSTCMVWILFISIICAQLGHFFVIKDFHRGQRPHAA